MPSPSLCGAVAGDALICWAQYANAACGPILTGSLIEGAMTGLRERSKLRRRKLVVDAAEKLFREKGYVGTTIENIASSADVSIGSLYSAFG